MELELLDIQAWILIFTLVAGITAAITTFIKGFIWLRSQSKKDVSEEHEYNLREHQQTRKEAKEAVLSAKDAVKDVERRLDRQDNSLDEIKDSIKVLTDIRISVAELTVKTKTHEDALRQFNTLFRRIEGNK